MAFCIRLRYDTVDLIEYRAWFDLLQP